jgi:hypothetical protein
MFTTKKLDRITQQKENQHCRYFFWVSSKNQNGGTDFFQVRIVIEEILPNLDAEMLQVMGLYSSFGWRVRPRYGSRKQSMKPFVDFCAAHHSRPVMGLEIIEDSPEPYASLSMQVLMAGARVDFEQYFESTLSFISSENTTTSRGAIFGVRPNGLPRKFRFTNSGI